MTLQISDRIHLSISITPKGVSAASLELPLLLAYHTKWADYTRTYTSPAGMISDGFAVTDPAYLMAQALLRQNPRVSSFKVGRRATAFTHGVELTVATTSGTIAVTISKGGYTATYSITGTGNSTTDATTLTTAINADEDGWGTSGDASFTCTSAAAVISIDDASTGNLWYYSGLTSITLDDVTADPGLAADLTALKAADDEWYAITLDSCSGAEGLGLAAALASDTKLVAVGSQDSDCIAASADPIVDLPGKLASLEYANSFVVYSPHSMAEYPAAAALGRFLPYPPGSIAWDLKKLTGVTAADLTTTQHSTLEAKYGNTCANYASNIGGVFQKGTLASGGYCGSRHLRDYLQFRIEEELMSTLLTVPKIPYRDPEAPMAAKAAILKVIKAAARNGGLTLEDTEGNSTFSFSYTPAADQLAGDKTARIFRGIEWSVELSGAVGQFYITGQLVGA